MSRPSFDNHPGKARWLRLLSERLPTASLGVLDLGCGTGHAARFFSTRHYYVGVDAKRQRIHEARELYPTRAFVRANYTKFDLPPCVADAVLALETFHYVSLDLVEPTVRRIANWLRPGGFFLLYTGRHVAALFVDTSLTDATGLRTDSLEVGPRSDGHPPKSLWLLAHKPEGVGEANEQEMPLAELVSQAAAREKQSRRRAEAVA